MKIITASRSYGAALLDFSEDFMKRFKEANKEFIDAQEEVIKRQEEREDKRMEEDREFLRHLLNDH